MALAGLDVHDIADIDLLRRPALGRHHAGTGGHDQDLVAGMGVPSGGAALAEFHHAAIVVRRIAGLDDRLARPRDRPGPAFDPIGAFDRQVRDVSERDDLHGFPPRVDAFRAVPDPRYFLAAGLDTRTYREHLSRNAPLARWIVCRTRSPPDTALLSPVLRTGKCGISRA